MCTEYLGSSETEFKKAVWREIIAFSTNKGPPVPIDDAVT